ncbi:hypothetical protein F7725_022047 [Dissostichus mawsoni]|uniref:Uncharacterized protein n=1 Tax=Dissostichus mawsoni TaxID=36200 RepID=A0A7J5ZGY9_DISMA|nr:hypothetical protein F7725_022047 [Dissostichus mawsoni]
MLNISALPSGGVKKLKKESLGTVLVTVLTVPRPLCFCFFLIVLNHMISGPSKENGSVSSGSDLIL